MNKLSSILGGAAVIAIAIVFVVSFGPAASHKGGADGPRCAIEIRGNCIATQDYWAAFRLIVPRNAEADRIRAMRLHTQTADGLIERWMLNEEAARIGVSVTDDELSAELRAGRVRVSLPADKTDSLGYSLGLTRGDVDPLRTIFVNNPKTKAFDVKTYEREVRTLAKMSPNDFREFQKKELIAARMRNLIKSRVRVAEGEAYEDFLREKSTAKIDYIRFDDEYYAQFVDTSEKVLAAYMEANKEELDKTWESRKTEFLPECRVTRHILVRAGSQGGGAEDESVKAAAKTRAEQILVRLKSGEKFADVARAVSDDTVSARRGGELGCIAKNGRMVKAFEDAVFGLDAGKLSELVESEFGFHIILVDRVAKDADAEKAGRLQIARERQLVTEAGKRSSAAAKAVLAAVKEGKTLAEALSTHLAELKSSAATPAKSKKPKKGEAAAPEAPESTEPEGQSPPSVESPAPFNLSGEPIPNPRADVDVARMVFALNKPGELVADIVPVQGGYAVVQLKEKAAATKEQWDKDHDYFVGQMRAKRQSDALVDYMRKLRSQLASEIKLEKSIVSEPATKGKDAGEAPAPPDGDE